MPVQHDLARLRFHLPPEQGEAYLDYRVVDDVTLDLHSTYVEPRLRGRGLAEQLVRGALAHARAEGKRVIATCSYVRAYLARHPQEEVRPKAG